MTTGRHRDIAHLGHAGLLIPVPEASLAFFTGRPGLTVVAEPGLSSPVPGGAPGGTGAMPGGPP